MPPVRVGNKALEVGDGVGLPDVETDLLSILVEIDEKDGVNGAVNVAKTMVEEGLAVCVAEFNVGGVEGEAI